MNREIVLDEQYYEKVAESKVCKILHYPLIRLVPFLMHAKYGKVDMKIPETVKELDGGAILAFKHGSNLDPIPALQTAKKAGFTYTRPIGKKSLFEKPVIGPAFHALGAYAVKRIKDGATEQEAERSRLMVHRAQVRLLERGYSILNFTEGTRQEDPRVVGELNKGPIYLSADSGRPIIPGAIAGVHSSEIGGRTNGFRNKSLPFGFGLPVVVALGSPIFVEDLSPFDYDTGSKKNVVDCYKEELSSRIQETVDRAYEIRDNS